MQLLAFEAVLELLIVHGTEYVIHRGEYRNFSLPLITSKKKGGAGGQQISWKSWLNPISPPPHPVYAPGFIQSSNIVIFKVWCNI